MVLLHGAAEWVLSRTQLSRLETLHNSWLRCITRDAVESPDSISTKDLMEKMNQLPISFIFIMRVPVHVQPIGRPCGTWMHDAMRDVKDIQMSHGGVYLVAPITNGLP